MAQRWEACSLELGSGRSPFSFVSINSETAAASNTVRHDLTIPNTRKYRNRDASGKSLDLSNLRCSTTVEPCPLALFQCESRRIRPSTSSNCHGHVSHGPNARQIARCHIGSASLEGTTNRRRSALVPDEEMAALPSNRNLMDGTEQSLMPASVVAAYREQRAGPYERLAEGAVSKRPPPSRLAALRPNGKDCGSCER